MPSRVGREWTRTIDLTVWSRVTQGCIRGPSMRAIAEYLCRSEEGVLAIEKESQIENQEHN